MELKFIFMILEKNNLITQNEGIFSDIVTEILFFL